jgi:hypothetical protein
MDGYAFDSAFLMQSWNLGHNTKADRRRIEQSKKQKLKFNWNNLKVKKVKSIKSTRKQTGDCFG